MAIDIAEVDPLPESPRHFPVIHLLQALFMNIANVPFQQVAELHPSVGVNGKGAVADVATPLLPIEVQTPNHSRFRRVAKILGKTVECS